MGKATTKKTDLTVVNPSTGEVIDPALLDDMIADAGMRERFGTEDLTIPRIVILQDLSDQVKPHKAEYVPGAAVGMIYNGINNALDTKLTFVPAKFHTPWIAWKPRPEGGLVNNNVDPAILTPENGFAKDGIDRFVGMMAPASDPTGDKVKVEVIKTPEWIGVARGASGWVMPVAISFPSTKAKAARKINTAIDLTEIEVAPGKFITPPAFYHTFTLTTAIEQAGQNEWFGWQVTHEGWQDTDPRLRDKAKDIRKSFEEGSAVVADPTAQ